MQPPTAPTTININAAAGSRIYVGNEILEVHAQRPSLAATMFGHIQNISATMRDLGRDISMSMLDRIQNISRDRACAIMASAYLVSLSVLLARMNANPEHEEQLQNSYMEGFRAGYAECSGNAMQESTAALLGYDEKNVRHHIHNVAANVLN